jgi:hypothetical protein
VPLRLLGLDRQHGRRLGGRLVRQRRGGPDGQLGERGEEATRPVAVTSLGSDRELQRLQRDVEPLCLLVQRAERRAADRLEVRHVAPGGVVGGLLEQLRGVGAGVLRGERPGDREPEQRQLPGGTRLLREPRQQRTAPVAGLGDPPRVQQRRDPLRRERSRQVARRGARTGADPLQPRETVGRVVDCGRRPAGAPFHDRPHQRHRRTAQLGRRTTDRGPRGVGGVERRHHLVGRVLDRAPGVGAQEIRGQLGIAVGAHPGEEPTGELDLSGARRHHRQLDPEAVGRGAGERVTAPAPQGRQHPARGLASVAGGGPCMHGPPRRGQPAVPLAGGRRLLEDVVRQLGREVGASPPQCRSRLDEVCVHPWYRSDPSAFGTGRPHVTS